MLAAAVRAAADLDARAVGLGDRDRAARADDPRAARPSRATASRRAGTTPRPGSSTTSAMVPAPARPRPAAASRAIQRAHVADARPIGTPGPDPSSRGRCRRRTTRASSAEDAHLRAREVAERNRRDDRDVTRTASADARWSRAIARYLRRRLLSTGTTTGMMPGPFDLLRRHARGDRALVRRGRRVSASPAPARSPADRCSSVGTSPRRRIARARWSYSSRQRPHPSYLIMNFDAVALLVLVVAVAGGTRAAPLPRRGRSPTPAGTRESTPASVHMIAVPPPPTTRKPRPPPGPSTRAERRGR